MAIFELFILNCTSLNDMKLILLSVDRMSQSNLIMKSFSAKYAQSMMKCFSTFLKRAVSSPDLDLAIDGVIRFIKRMVKYDLSHEAMIQTDMCNLIFTSVGKPSHGKFIQNISTI